MPEQLTDKDLIRWVSIIRAQKRLPKYTQEAIEKFTDKPNTEILRARIKKYIDGRLESERNPAMGEAVKVFCRVTGDGATVLDIELYAEDEKTTRP